MKLFRSLFSSPGCEEAKGQATTPTPSVHGPTPKVEPPPANAAPASTSEPAPEESKQTPSPTCVGDSVTCPEGARLQAKVEGRYVTIIRLDGKLACIDAICFHAGGPLGIGDIEDVNGRKCIVCPWHFYKIDVESGDKYYQTMEFKEGKMQAGEWKSNGVRQRTHKTWEEGGKIYVQLSTYERRPSHADYVESDGYAFDEKCGDRCLNSPPSANKLKVHSAGADGRKPPSGQVLRGQYRT
ncbi:hypothetical protein CHLRE_04g219450v5 [Chlamydomonas reinhardtii]|uniref:Rieske domain-containing protein n=1 Tax=Chlamydomonas reinhardtii TaxID=3055 RepID=A0A2K3DU59_CHLRE|nr:uncharacterized protein CHLRE_04g219450v5 [Chlamydomonas reinhardtii]PNW84055.1 hypothetical protein CHLRE_04g219450v5 [Chlamydomonas reinhardtii]